MVKKPGSLEKLGAGLVVGPLGLILLVGLSLPGRLGLAGTSVIVGLLMAFVLGAIGVHLGKGWLGVLIDPARNMMSLSRLQVVLWTWVILSAFVAVALGRVWDSRLHPDAYTCPAAETIEAEAECADPLGIQLPELLWALMGISVTSAVASPLLKTAKAQRTEQEDQTQRRTRGSTRRDGSKVTDVPTYRETFERRKADDPGIEEQVGDAQPTGVMVRKDSWDKATFSDMFTGEEVSNFGYVDVAKVQNFFFTLIAVIAYATALLAAMSTAKGIAGFFVFPDVPAGLVAVISISHGGYLIDKALTHSTPAEEPPPEV